jgi:serine/threonine protein kinase
MRKLPMKLDDYQLNRLIGKGSFGEVYETTNSCNQVFATKIIKKFKLIGIVKEYFDREVTISKILEHENIIKLIDIKESEIEHYLIMEYADGFNLSELLSYYKEIYKKTQIKDNSNQISSS